MRRKLCPARNLTAYGPASGNRDDRSSIGEEFSQRAIAKLDKRRVLA